MTIKEYVQEQLSVLLSDEFWRELRMARNCSDEEIGKHPEWLVEHFFDSGRAQVFFEENRRKIQEFPKT